jgi:glucose-6-phosphate 1-dehydrogenase
MTPFAFIIFGATGDLIHRKIMPAIYYLAKKGELSTPIYFVGVGRRELTVDQFAGLMEKAVHDAVGEKFDDAVWSKLFAGFEYVQGDFADPKTYDEIVKVLEQFDTTMKACVPRFFYLATPPLHYETILMNLKKSKLSEGCGQGTNIYTRLLIEKPFGSDLTTAQHLDKLLGSIFEEKQIYRIDHYLGKETVQNVLAFRFANGIFEPTWNGEFVDHVQITLAEREGVGTRGDFYDSVGALRDVVQNHMLEMLATIAMEQPKGFDAGSIRDEKAKVLQSLDIEHITAVRGRYEGYEGKAETYAAVKFMLTGRRWKGVPFYLRTGKSLAKKTTEISLHYKKPVCATDPTGNQVCFFDPDTVMRNVLTIQIDPAEGIDLRLMVKEPGLGDPAEPGIPGMKLAPTVMKFSYASSFGITPAGDEYERLLLDTIRGDQTLFARTDTIAASWRFITTILDGWKTNNPPIYPYEAGSWGPKEADAMIQKDGRHWFLAENTVK